jgi:hypothetical protein
MSSPQINSSPHPEIVGDLGEWPASGILMWLHETGRTATMRVRCGSTTAIVRYEDGVLLACECNGSYGEDALFTVLGLASGTFAITHGVERTERNIVAPVEEVILRWGLACDRRRHAMAS